MLICSCRYGYALLCLLLYIAEPEGEASSRDTGVTDCPYIHVHNIV